MFALISSSAPSYCVVHRHAVTLSSAVCRVTAAISVPVKARRGNILFYDQRISATPYINVHENLKKSKQSYPLLTKKAWVFLSVFIRVRPRQELIRIHQWQEFLCLSVARNGRISFLFPVGRLRAAPV